jgi:hypothetical protein
MAIPAYQFARACKPIEQVGVWAHSIIELVTIRDHLEATNNLTSIPFL